MWEVFINYSLYSFFLFIIYLGVEKPNLFTMYATATEYIFTCKTCRYLRDRISKIHLLPLPNPILCFHSLFSNK